jgi:hypothetical protein
LSKQTYLKKLQRCPLRSNWVLSSSENKKIGISKVGFRSHSANKAETENKSEEKTQFEKRRSRSVSRSDFL